MAYETLAGQDGPGLGRLQRGDEFGFGNEGQVGCAGSIDRRNTAHAAGEIGSLARLGSGQRGNLGDAEIRVARKKTELGQNSRPLRRSYITRQGANPKPNSGKRASSV